MARYTSVKSWISSEDKEFRLSRQVDMETSPRKEAQGTVITVDDTALRQPMVGWGATFMDSDIYHFQRMPPAVAERALRWLFHPEEGAGWNMMRISFGSSDWNRDWNFYTYDDMPAGEHDAADLPNFSIDKDIQLGHIDVIKKALAVRPDLRIIASVWGPPAWMKDNGSLIAGGSILPEYYRAYAVYLRKCIQAYQEQGIPILSVTPQNESLCNDGRVTPQALWMDWRCARDFHLVLRDEFDSHGISTEIWAFDHNFIYAKDWVAPFLEDDGARSAIDGMAWHDYEGEPDEMAALISRYPQMPMYLTERRQYTVDGAARILKLLGHGARTYLHWVTISDEYFAPHQFSGGGDTSFCSDANTTPQPESKMAALVCLRQNPEVAYKISGYYIFAQISRFIRQDAVRIESAGECEGITHLAAINPDKALVVAVANTSYAPQTFTIRLQGSDCAATLPGRAVGTYLFS